MSSQNAKHCLSYLDKQLEKTSEQTIDIAEVMIADMSELISKSNKMGKEEYFEEVKETHLKWIKELSEIILAQANRDLSGQVILKLNDFLENPRCEFVLPGHVAKELNLLEGKDVIDNSAGILSQEQIDEFLKDI